METLAAATGNNFMTVVAVLTVLVFCVVPGIVATARNHPNAGAVWALSILFGWSVIGWIAAFVWAFAGSNKQPRRQVRRFQAPRRPYRR